MKSNFINESIDFIFNSEIYEYDMKSAGLSVIEKYSLLSKEEIENIKGMEKEERNIFIGKLNYTNKDIHSKISNYIKKEMEMFINNNSIKETDIISIKKDAIFVKRHCEETDQGKVIFIEKNKYSSYIYLKDSKIELYYNNSKIDVKGIHDDKLKFHEDYLLSFIFTLISLIETDVEKGKKYLNQFVMLYKKRQLESEFYRTFNSESSFKTIDDNFLSSFDDSYREDLNILYNFKNLILPLIRILVYI